MTPEQATFTNENDRAKITIVAQNMQVETLSSEFSFQSYVYILITIK
ncbi:hypothetical protein SDC9_169267 [bioreactor metagenome]|uniref:Uncharacterized protein n=1 Tax=bioreactor metagenome TaxID=1076179 RepID=A0A645G5G3_9ZZZZ